MKTTGAVWKQYLDSWPIGQWFDDSNETFDGKEPMDGEPAPTAVVEFSCGTVLDEGNKEVDDLVQHFEKWLRAQSNTAVLVEVPNDKLDEFKALAATVGAKVIA